MHKHSGMYLVTNTFAEAWAFLIGYDEAVHGGLLAGFREWLVVRTDGRSNLAIPSLVLKFVAPRAKYTTLTPEENRLALDALFNLLDEYLSLGDLENRVATATQLETHQRISRWPCLCCGFATLTDKPPGSNLNCPVCFWQDNLLGAEQTELTIKPNRVSLDTARMNFLEFGAAEKRLLKLVRSPTGVEQPRLPIERLTPATDRLFRARFPRVSDDPKLGKIHLDLGYWSVFVDCIVFPLIAGEPAIDSGLDVGQGLVDVRGKLKAILANPDVPDRELLLEYLAHCELLTEVWQSTNPRWDGMEWVVQSGEAN